MRTRMTILALAAALAGAAGVSGCRAGAAGSGAGAGVAQAAIVSQGVVDASPVGVVAAAKAALAEMDIALVSDRAGDMEGEVIGRMARDSRVAVIAERVNEGSSRVTIRADTSGDDDRHVTLLQKIRERL